MQERGILIKKVVFHVVDGPFHFAFGAWTIRAVSLWGEAVVIGELEKQRVQLLLPAVSGLRIRAMKDVLHSSEVRLGKKRNKTFALVHKFLTGSLHSL